MSEPERTPLWLVFAFFAGGTAMTLGIIWPGSWKDFAWTLLVSVAFGLVAVIQAARGRRF